jgi:hypothetical protein
LRIVPRTASTYQPESFTMPNGEQAVVVRGGVILSVTGGGTSLDIEADRLVFWTKAGEGQRALDSMRGGQDTRATGDRRLEFYLAGNVELRHQQGKDIHTIRAEEMYYDVNRNVAIARHADLEMKDPSQPEPVHVVADELLQLGSDDFKAMKTDVFSSSLPSDPGFKINLNEVDIEKRKTVKTSLFGTEVIDRQTGQPKEIQQTFFTGRQVFFELQDVPVFYLPYLSGDVNEPLGPLQDVALNYDKVFGFQTRITLNMYTLLGLDPVPFTNWRGFVDYLDKRGPALGGAYSYNLAQIFGEDDKINGLFKVYGIQDRGKDILGSFRGFSDFEPLNILYTNGHPDYRGRMLFRQDAQDLPYGFTVQAQTSLLSDKNFLEQFYKVEFDTGPNQESFLYVKQQGGNAAWTGLTEGRIRNWVTETNWLPRADGWLLGTSFFDFLTYNVHGSAGYAELHPTHVSPFPVVPTDVFDNTGRFDVFQEISAPLPVGPLKVVPYGVIDVTYYTQDAVGDSRTRVYGGGGVRTSMPLSRLYPEASSDLFNVNGINHKMVWSANYYNAYSNTNFTLLPQLDRLDDDATDQARRDYLTNFIGTTTPVATAFNPGHGIFLARDPLFNVQTYAIRRLVDNRTDTLQSIEELQVDLRQRWQTKRGYPGMQHVVDWMTLDMSATYFPDSGRDNFSKPFAFCQYDWLWNVGDRTALTSSGWYDPIPQGPRVTTVGLFFNRTDRTTFFVGLRTLYPTLSEAVTGAVTYVFSPKYAVTGATTYDFGVGQAVSNILTFTRTGKDLQVSMGVSYTPQTNNFGFNFSIFPNILPMSQRTAMFGSTAAGSNSVQQSR